MFEKILIANRGEIAVRILRACREMGIATVALVPPSDQGSLHLRLADECVTIGGPEVFTDPQEILRAAQDKGAQAIHPGYGFLSEDPTFARACEAAGVQFIGPPALVLERLLDRATCRQKVRAAGFPVVEAANPFQADSLVGHWVSVQILADAHGHVLHLGERESTLQYSGDRLIEEAPSPCLTPEQRQPLFAAALQIARLLGVQNVASIEFIIPPDGQPLFWEVKNRIQPEHPLTEALYRLDLVKAQIQLAAGDPLTLRQEDLRATGTALLCRINAQDAHEGFIPSPGIARRFHLPSGLGVRADSALFPGCEISTDYGPLLAKVIAWADDRHDCLNRMRAALDEFEIDGVLTNLPLLKNILARPELSPCAEGQERAGARQAPPDLRDLAAAAALLYFLRAEPAPEPTPERWQTGWHRRSRRIPE